MATVQSFEDVMNYPDVIVKSNSIAFERPKMADMIYFNQPRTENRGLISGITFLKGNLLRL